MATSVVKHSQGDDEVYEVVGGALIGAGLLVIPAAGSTSALQGVGLATDAAQNVLGVTAKEALPAALVTAQLTGTDVNGYPFVSTGVPGSHVTAYSHAITYVSYTAAAVAYGTPLVAAANGQVRAFVSGTDNAAAIVGHARAAVPAAGGFFLAKITV